MQVGLLQMPLERVVKVQLDGDLIPGYIKCVERKGVEVWEVHQPGKTLRTTPASKEAAAMLLLYHHFETERKRIRHQREASDLREAPDERAGAEGEEMGG